MSNYNVTKKFREFLLKQQKKYAEASRPAEEFRSEQVREATQIRDALNAQDRKDNIALNTGFEDLITKRRKVRVDNLIKTSLSRLLDDIQDSSRFAQSRSSLNQLKDLILSNDGTSDVMKLINDALFEIKWKFIPSFADAERKVLGNLADEVETISRIKNETPQDFKDRIKKLNSSDLDKLDKDDLKILAVNLGIEKSLSNITKNELLKEIKAKQPFSGSDTKVKNVQEFSENIEKNARKIQKDVEEHIPTDKIVKFLDPMNRSTISTSVIIKNKRKYEQEYKQLFKTFAHFLAVRHVKAARVPEDGSTPEEKRNFVISKLLDDPLNIPLLRDLNIKKIKEMDLTQLGNVQKIVDFWKYYKAKPTTVSEIIQSSPLAEPVNFESIAEDLKEGHLSVSDTILKLQDALNVLNPEFLTPKKINIKNKTKILQEKGIPEPLNGWKSSILKLTKIINKTQKMNPDDLQFITNIINATTAPAPAPAPAAAAAAASSAAVPVFVPEQKDKEIMKKFKTEWKKARTDPKFPSTKLTDPQIRDQLKFLGPADVPIYERIFNKEGNLTGNDYDIAEKFLKLINKDKKEKDGPARPSVDTESTAPTPPKAKTKPKTKASGIKEIVTQLNNHINMLLKMKKITAKKAKNAKNLVKLAIKTNQLDKLGPALRKMGI